MATVPTREETTRRLDHSANELDRRPLVGRHLQNFTCDGCGRHENHGLAVVVMGEVAYCWPCVMVMVTSDEQHDDENKCPHCWPQTCPTDGTTLRDQDHRHEHLALAHP